MVMEYGPHWFAELDKVGADRHSSLRVAVVCSPRAEGSGTVSEYEFGRFFLPVCRALNRHACPEGFADEDLRGGVDP
jgi:hypothetical protein